MLAAAHFQQYSGLLRCESPRGWYMAIRTRHGRIADITGIHGFLQDISPSLKGESALLAAIPLAMQASISPMQVVDSALNFLVDRLASMYGETRCRSSFQEADPDPGHGLVVQTSIPSIIERALRAANSVTLAEKWLSRNRSTPLEPTDLARASSTGMELDSMALRVLRLARTTTTTEDLLAQAAGGSPSRRREVLHRLMLLFQLGLLEPSSPPAQRHDSRQPPATRNWPRQGSSIAYRSSRRPMDPAPDGPPPTDPRITRMQEALQKLESQYPLQRLQLDNANRKPGRDEISNAFREISRRYHPDRYSEAPPRVGTLAQKCFTLLSETYDRLLQDSVLSEEWRRVQCTREGIPYVSRKDHAASRISFKRGELQFRNKDYTVAEACFAKALELEPFNWEYVHMHSLSAFLAGQMPAAEAISRLRALKLQDKPQQAVLQVTMGRIARLSGSPQKQVMAHFHKAASLDPENRDAQREIWLHQRRSKTSGGRSQGFLQRFRTSNKSSSHNKKP